MLGQEDVSMGGKHRAPEGQGASPSEEPVSKHKKVVKAKIALEKKTSPVGDVPTRKSPPSHLQ